MKIYFAGDYGTKKRTKKLIKLIDKKLISYYFIQDSKLSAQYCVGYEFELIRRNDGRKSSNNSNK